MMSVIKKESSGPSRVLFLNVKGEPMHFFIRPGPSKVQLQPLILNGGGVLCRSQEPNAILLADPGDITAAVGGISHFYISTQYIHDCVAQNQQLDMEKYRFSSSQAVQTRAASRKQQVIGRLGYSIEDDTAILNYIAKHLKEVKGNQVWQQMERQHITNHSWQSMKDRFLKHLQHKLEKKSPEKKTKSSSSSEDNTFTPKKTAKKKAKVDSSSDSDITQISQEHGGATTEQPALQVSSEEVSGPQDPASEKKQTEELRKEADGEESVPEEEQQHISEQPEVSPKRARMDTDAPVEDTSLGPNEQFTAPSEKQNASKLSATLAEKLNILKIAAREFEYSQKLDGSQDDPSLSQTSVKNTLDTAASQIMAARERALREREVHPEHPKDTDKPAAAPQYHRSTPRPEDETAGPSNAAAPVTSDAHMFLFQQESQEELSQPSEEDEPSQSLLETEQHVVRLVQESKKDLVEVMKALLKASGDVSLALSYLLEGFDPEVHGPIWTQEDDEILRSADPFACERLHEKYGADRVSKRAAFLKADL